MHADGLRNPWRQQILCDRSLSAARRACAIAAQKQEDCMRRAWVFALLLVAGLAQAAPSKQQDGRTAEVLKIEHAWCDAYRRADIAYLEKLMTPDFTLISSGGTVNTAASEIDELKTGKVKYTTFENRDMQVRFYGDTAVVIGRTHAAGVSEGTPFDIDVAFTDVLVKIDGRWRAVAGHASRKAS
jgi:ketosteroid isomerase-like protein